MQVPNSPCQSPLAISLPVYMHLYFEKVPQASWLIIQSLYEFSFGYKILEETYGFKISLKSKYLFQNQIQRLFLLMKKGSVHNWPEFRTTKFVIFERQRLPHDGVFNYFKQWWIFPNRVWFWSGTLLLLVILRFFRMKWLKYSKFYAINTTCWKP